MVEVRQLDHHLERYGEIEEVRMFEFVQNLGLTNPLELYTAVIATLGVAFWAIDRRSMKAALHASRVSEISVLRLERRKTEASVERSFAILQMKCRATRAAWKNQNWQNGPILSSGLRVSAEEKEIWRVEHAGKSLFDQFKAAAPRLDSSEIDELEVHFVSAGRTCLEIERLASQLPDPTSRVH